MWLLLLFGGDEAYKGLEHHGIMLHLHYIPTEANLPVCATVTVELHLKLPLHGSEYTLLQMLYSSVGMGDVKNVYHDYDDYRKQH